MLIIVYTKETAYSGLYTCFHKYLVSTRCAKGLDGFIIVLKVDVGHEYMQILMTLRFVTMEWWTLQKFLMCYQSLNRCE